MNGGRIERLSACMRSTFDESRSDRVSTVQPRSTRFKAHQTMSKVQAPELKKVSLLSLLQARRENWEASVSHLDEGRRRRATPGEQQSNGQHARSDSVRRTRAPSTEAQSLRPTRTIR